MGRSNACAEVGGGIEVAAVTCKYKVKIKERRRILVTVVTIALRTYVVDY